MPVRVAFISSCSHATGFARRFSAFLLGAFVRAGLFWPLGWAGRSTLPAQAISTSGAAGQPIHWAGGELDVYVDPGPLNAGTGTRETMVDGHGCDLECAAHGRRYARRQRPAARSGEWIE